MLKEIVITLFVLSSTQLFGWGLTGHRVVGQVAENHLSKKAKSKIQSILGDETLAIVSVWMDEERSNPKYDHTVDWHWVTIPDGMTYAETVKNPNGDVIATINRLIVELKAGGLTKEQEIERIKMLVHFVGDIHQPLHVGKEGDRGGNAVKVKWFWNSTNLHSIWDSKIIDDKQFSYTELAAAIDHPSKDQINKWQSEGVLVWADESIALRDQVYNFPEDKELSYQYLYDNWATVQLRLLKAGVRLAGILNEIYN
ncbi:MAG TPA: S1/P1 nuclease [Fulvivirga sp.]|nr:S1/P1 nuclease [Fulvivirga sp.]